MASLTKTSRSPSVSSAPDGSMTVASLIGKHHELMTIFSGPAPALANVGELYAVLDLDDTAEGMRVAPQPATGLTMMNEHVLLVCDDSVSFDLPGPAHADQMVPRHRGGKTRHGEIWRTLLPGRSGARPHDYSYVVGTPTGAAEVEVSPRTRSATSRRSPCSTPST